MARYIELDALVTEIKRRKTQLVEMGNEFHDKWACGTLDIILSFLDTLEAKEIDLEKELESWRHNHFHGRRDKEASGEYLERVSQLNLAKHFFELGISVSNPTTAADRGIVEEIIFTLNTLGEEKMISYDKEIEWLRNKVKKIE